MPPIKIPLLDNLGRLGDTVLDVGCGDSPYWKATALVDISTKGTEAARYSAKAYRGELPGAPFFKADACKGLPFPDKHFDWCVCRFALTSMDDVLGACREMSRVAKAGYIEFPTTIREIIHNTPGSKWLGRLDDDGTLVFRRKEPTDFWTGDFEFCHVRCHASEPQWQAAIEDAHELLVWSEESRIVQVWRDSIKVRVE